MIVNFERDMIWPDIPVRIATWGTPAQTGVSPAISQDGSIGTNLGYVRGPNNRPILTGNQWTAYGIGMLPALNERCVYRVIADGDAPGFVGYCYANITGSGEINPVDADVVFIGGLQCDVAVAIPPHPTDDSLSLLFYLTTESTEMDRSYLQVQRLVGRPPQYALSVS